MVAGGLPMGEVRAVQINGGGAGGERDLGTDEFAGLFEVEEVGDGEVGVDVGEGHGGISVRAGRRW